MSIIIADNDDPGFNHAEDIADILDGIASTVGIVRAAVGKDAADHIAAGKKLSEFVTVTGFNDTDPIPLTGIVSLPSFPSDAFPTPIADMVRGVAEATQTDPAMAGTSAISALSACAGGNVEIQIRDGWVEPLCTYSAAVAESGERKTAVQKPMLGPVLDVEAELVEATIPRTRMRWPARKSPRRYVDRNWSTLRKTNTVDRRMEAGSRTMPGCAAGGRRHRRSRAAPARRRRCHARGGRIAAGRVRRIHRGRHQPRAAVFDIIAGRYNGNIPNMDVWLKGHSGDMIRVDRKGRPPEYIRKPAMTLGLMIQPEVLKSIAAQPSFRGRGLIARFLYAMPVSKVGYRKTNAAPVSRYRAERVQHPNPWPRKGIAEDLTAIRPCSSSRPKRWRRSPRSKRRRNCALREDGALASLRDWGGKYVAAVARIAGLLHLAEHGCRTAGTHATH